ncbi:MAG: iron-containing alcohol dehydrogenase [Thermodesulfobacteriota bacterium]|nr:iron-containing alcohol dehydrogenase [Thermodesulfobacteriota bacterium]
MQNFIFENPTKIIFGKGQIAKAGREVAKFGKKVLMVYGKRSIKKSGVYDQVVTSLQDADIEIVEFSGVKANPVLSRALNGVEVAREKGVDVVLAVGGGSVIDTAKTIAVGAKADGDLWDYFTHKKVIKDALPVLTVVTLSASASEMNPAAVITKEDGAQKFSIRSPFIQPKTSILDPTTLFTLGPSYSAYSAVDAIIHMLEGYFNNTEPESAMQDSLVESIMKTIMESTEVILRDPADYNARANMMWSAILAFNGLTTAGMGMVSLPAHMIEHSLSALYDIAHGAGLSIIMPAWMSYVVGDNPSKFARLGREIFGVEEDNDLKAGREGIKRLREWFASIESPVSFKEAGIPEGDIGKIAENARELAKVWGLKNYTEEVIADILKLCI